MAFKFFKSDDELIEKELSKYEVSDEEKEDSVEDTIEEAVTEEVQQEETVDNRAHQQNVDEQFADIVEEVTFSIDETIETPVQTTEGTVNEEMDEFALEFDEEDEATKKIVIGDQLAQAAVSETEELGETKVFEKPDSVEFESDEAKETETITEAAADGEEEDDDDEYEYVVPHYLRNAVLVAAGCAIIGFALMFLLCQSSLEEKYRTAYIEAGYVKTTDATATASDIRLGKTAYVNGVLVEGTYTDIDTSYATATAEDILAGYTAYVDGELITGTIPTYSGTTQFFASTEDQVIEGGVYISPSTLIIVSGDGNLKASNIKKGVDILGVTGTYEGD